MADSRRHSRDDVYRTDTRHVAQKIRVAPLGHLLGHLLVFGVAFFFSFEALSSWYFDEYIVPAQQAELAQ